MIDAAFIVAKVRLRNMYLGYMAAAKEGRAFHFRGLHAAMKEAVDAYIGGV